VKIIEGVPEILITTLFVAEFDETIYAIIFIMFRKSLYFLNN